MNRTTAIVITVIAVLICGCPALCAGVSGIQALGWTTQDYIQNAENSGIELPTRNPADLEMGLQIARVSLCGIGVIGILIPLVVGLVLFRMAKKNSANVPPNYPPTYPPAD